MENNKSKGIDPKWTLAVPPLAAAATYGLLRRPLNLTKAEKLSKGKLTFFSGFGTDMTPKMEAIKKIKDEKLNFKNILEKLKWRDINYTDNPKIKPKGAVYNYVDSNEVWKKLPTGDVGWNSNVDIWHKTLSDKVKYNQLKSKHIAKGGHISDKIGTPSTKADFIKKIKNLADKEDVYIKEIRGAQGGRSKGNQFNSEDLKKLIKNKPTSKKLDNLYKKRNDLMWNENIPTKTEGKLPTSEQRIHFAVDNEGNVKSFLPFWRHQGISRTKEIPKVEAEKAMKDIVDKNPKTFKGQGNFIIAADVLRSSKDNKLKFIEMNDSSGWLQYPMHHGELYKAITGRNTSYDSAKKALIVGGATTAVPAAAIAYKKFNEKK